MAGETAQPSGQRPREASSAVVVLVLRPPMGRADVAGWCERLTALAAANDAGVIVCDLAAVVDVDAVTVETVARLKLTAGRLGKSIRLYRPNERLLALLTLTGLRAVLEIQSGSGLQTWRQTEEWEQPLGVEERVDSDDPPA